MEDCANSQDTFKQVFVPESGILSQSPLPEIEQRIRENRTLH